MNHTILLSEETFAILIIVSTAARGYTENIWIQKCMLALI